MSVQIQIDLKYDANFLFLDDSFKQIKQCWYEYIDLIPSISVSLPSIIQLQSIDDFRNFMKQMQPK